jgi:hypothetical protein
VTTFSLTSEKHENPNRQGELGLEPIGLLEHERKTFKRVSAHANHLAADRGEQAARLELEANDLVGTDQEWARLQVLELRDHARQLYAAALLLADENGRVNPDGKRIAAKYVEKQKRTPERRHVRVDAIKRST